MKIKTILYSSRFQYAFKKLGQSQKQLIQQREKIFKNDCFDQRLKTHKLKGQLKDHWSFSLTYSHRVLFTFLENDQVVFMDVGSHSIYQ